MLEEPITLDPNDDEDEEMGTEDLGDDTENSEDDSKDGYGDLDSDDNF